MRIDAAIDDAARRLRDAGVDSPRLDAKLLLAWSLNCRREDLAREPEREIDHDGLVRFQTAIGRRAERVPLPYITGAQEFYGRRLMVNPSVLIPRPETEMVVSQALKRIQSTSSARVADIGTGSGCLAVTVALERPDAFVTAVDISQAALDVARSNADALGAGGIDFVLGDLMELLGETYDLVVSNPPYISRQEIADLMPEVRDYEPQIALAGVGAATGMDGVDLYRRLFAQAADRLGSGGWIVVEIGLGQANAVMDAARTHGFDAINAYTDYAGIPRIVEGMKPE